MLCTKQPVICCRTLDTDAIKDYNETGKLQSFEFGTFLPVAKMIWKAITGILFKGGASEHHCPHTKCHF